MKKVLISLAVVTLLFAGCSSPAPTQKPPVAPENRAAQPPVQQGQTTAKSYSAPPTMQIDPKKEYSALVKTNKGDIRIKLFAAETPKTVNNFVFLARDKFYDGVKFHRVIKEFMIQTGDPKGDGTGGPGYKFADELPAKHQYAPGIVAMANAGPNTNGSQFFICSGEQAKNLNSRPNYTVFGQVESGMEVVQKIASVPVGPDSSGRETSSPKEEVKIISIEIAEK